MKRIIILLLCIFPVIIQAQNKNDIKVKLGGFVSAESIFDTRKTVNAREGEVILYPAAKSYDINGNDLNDRSELFMTSIHSRLNVGVTGFEVWGAKGSATVEADFVGTSNDKTGLFRLRHAFVKLDWGKDELLVGKYWHPMFVTSCFPKVLHWGGGLPFNVLGRAPQFRYTHKFGNKSYFLIAALSEMDFKSNGPEGPNVKYIQQASIPEFSGQLKYNFTNNFAMGFTAGYKFLKPMIVNSKGAKTDEVLSSYQMNAWMTLQSKKIVWNLHSIYGQNMYNFVMLGGYGVKNVKSNGDYEYTNIKTSSIWSDIYTKTGKVRYGFFAGYTKNLGADENLATNDKGFVGLYSRGSNIDYVYQFGPRIQLHYGKFMIGTQMLYTSAAYGKTQINGKVSNSKEVGSSRFMIHLKYSF